MLICIKYTDGEICVTREDIDDAMSKKENSGNRNDCRSSPLKVAGTPTTTRTWDPLLRRLNIA